MKKFLAAICAAAMLITGCGDEKISQEVTWGRADAKEIDINSKIPGRVVKLLVAEGDSVQAGQISHTLTNETCSRKNCSWKQISRRLKLNRSKQPL